MLDFDSLSVVDYLRSGALIVAFLATACCQGRWCSGMCSGSAGKGRGDPHMFYRADTLAMAILGLGALCFPATLLGYVTVGKMDIMHTYFAQAMGAILIAQAVLGYNTGEEGRASFTLSKVVTAACILMVMVNTHIQLKDKPQRLSNQHVSFAMLGCMLHFLGNLRYLFQLESFGRRSNQHTIMDWRNAHLMILGMLLFVYHLIFGFAFPEKMESMIGIKDWKMDGIHVNEFRLMACMSIGGALHFFNAMHFDQSNENDRKACFLSFLTVMGIFLPIVGYYHYFYNVIGTSLVVFAVASAAEVLIAVHGYVGYQDVTHLQFFQNLFSSSSGMATRKRK